MKDIFKDFELKFAASIMYTVALLLICTVIVFLYTAIGLIMFVIPIIIGIMYLIVHKFHLY